MSKLVEDLSAEELKKYLNEWIEARSKTGPGSLYDQHYLVSITADNVQDISALLQIMRGVLNRLTDMGQDK